MEWVFDKQQSVYTSLPCFIQNYVIIRIKKINHRRRRSDGDYWPIRLQDTNCTFCEKAKNYFVTQFSLIQQDESLQIIEREITTVYEIIIMTDKIQVIFYCVRLLISNQPGREMIYWHHQFCTRIKLHYLLCFQLIALRCIWRSYILKWCV